MALRPLPTLPPPDRLAILLDFDGTLVDIAPSPDQVVVPQALRAALLDLRAACGEALAIVSGRPIAQIDHFLPGVPYAVAGEHGAAIRHTPDGPVERVDLPDVPPAWLTRAEALVGAYPGAHLERKSTGFVLHYRGAPAAGDALHAALAEIVATAADRFHILRAKMAWEVRPAGADKGSAVGALMARAPFQGRLPLFIGDDITDQDAIDAAERQGGFGLMVPERFGEPEQVRAWLAERAQAWKETAGETTAREARV